MGSLYIKLKQFELAEANLVTATHVDPSSHEAWFLSFISY